MLPEGYAKPALGFHGVAIPWFPYMMGVEQDLFWEEILIVEIFII